MWLFACPSHVSHHHSVTTGFTLPFCLRSLQLQAQDDSKGEEERERGQGRQTHSHNNMNSTHTHHSSWPCEC